MRKPTLWLGVAALFLWAATAILTVTYDGNGSPVRRGLVMLLALVVSVAFVSTLVRRRKSSSGDGLF